jgi:hypothetical protein
MLIWMSSLSSTLDLTLTYAQCLFVEEDIVEYTVQDLKSTRHDVGQHDVALITKILGFLMTPWLLYIFFNYLQVYISMLNIEQPKNKSI